MKKKSLILLLIMALMVIIPANAKAFTVNPAGLNCTSSTNPNGVENGICYTGTPRHITFITQQGDTSVNYFCLSENKELGPHAYGDTPTATYTDSGYACAVHNLLANGSISLSDLDDGYFNFGTITGYDSNYNVSSVTGSALVYTKLQTEMWRIGENATCTPYTEQTEAPTMSLSAGPMTLTTDGNYYYSKITVTKTGTLSNYTIILENAPEGTIRSSSTSATDVIAANQQISANEFYVLVPTASATTATVRVKTQYNYNLGAISATMYKYAPTSHTANQDLGRLRITKSTTPQQIVAQTQVTLNPSVDFKVCKKDSKTNQPMAGVEFKITSEDRTTTFNLTTGTDGCAIKENVKQVKYTISEVNTPNGYVKLIDQSVDCSTINGGQVCIATVKNTPIQLKVKKLDESGAALIDAKMQILDKDGNVFDEWTSVLEDHVVSGNIPFGKYTLREEEAPNGYVISTEIEFTIAEDKYYIGTTAYDYGSDATVTVEMVDEPTKVSILKINSETGLGLAGATLRVEDVDGNVVDEWVSTSDAHVIQHMPFGTYYLIEVAAPEGYVLNTEPIEFTVSQTSSNEEVTMHNVPDTLAAKSALLISFAMFDIALGVGILLYVNKRKETE